MFDFRNYLLAGLLTLSTLVSNSMAGDDKLVVTELLNKARIDSLWQIQIPLKPEESLEKVYVYDKYLYILTSRNIFFCIDRSTSDLRAVFPMAIPGLPILPPLHFENKSGFLVGQELKIFDPAAGQIVRTLNLLDIGGNFGSISRNKDYVYICGAGNRLSCFKAEDEVRLFSVTADNNSAIYTVIASNDMVWFGTSAGNIYALQTSTPDRIWKFTISGNMEAPLILDGEFIYAGGLDTKVYKLNAKNGSPVWKDPYYSGDKIRDPMTMGKTCIYVHTLNTGLHAINKETGAGVWNDLKANQVLSENDTIAYVYKQPGVLVLMDNLTGQETLSINIAQVDRFAVNMADSAIYFANKDGRIQAVLPRPQKNTKQ